MPTPQPAMLASEFLSDSNRNSSVIWSNSGAIRLKSSPRFDDADVPRIQRLDYNFNYCWHRRIRPSIDHHRRRIHHSAHSCTRTVLRGADQILATVWPCNVAEQNATEFWSRSDDTDAPRVFRMRPFGMQPWFNVTQSCTKASHRRRVQSNHGQILIRLWSKFDSNLLALWSNSKSD